MESSTLDLDQGRHQAATNTLFDMRPSSLPSVDMDFTEMQDLALSPEDMMPESLDLSLRLDMLQPEDLSLGPVDFAASQEMGNLPPEGAVPAILLQGHMGRTTLSCDGGKTWVAEHSQDDKARCGRGGNTECDHHSYSAAGIAFGDGFFYTSVGHGKGHRKIDRSSDGVIWTQAYANENERPIDQLTFGANMLLGSCGYYPCVGANRASMWSQSSVRLKEVTRQMAYGLGRFWILGSYKERVSIRTSTDGQTWHEPSGLTNNPECGTYISGIIEGGGRLLILSRRGSTCVSTDGQNFIMGNTEQSLSSNVVWDGLHFTTYKRGFALQSSDGLSWSMIPLTGDAALTGSRAKQTLSKIAYEPFTKSFVAVTGTSYSDQHFYHSKDGVSWTRSSSYKGSHPARGFAVGYVTPSEKGCPMPSK